jgi:hypothetical protein
MNMLKKTVTYYMKPVRKRKEREQRKRTGNYTNFNRHAQIPNNFKISKKFTILKSIFNKTVILSSSTIV